MTPMSFRVARRVRAGVGGLTVVLGSTIALIGCGSGSTSTTSRDATKSSDSGAVVSGTTTVVSGGGATTLAPSPGAGAGGTGTSTPAPGTSAPPDASAAAPVAPTGLFLNSHELSLSGNGVPAAGHSVCRTSPGATCVVRFVSDSGTVALGAKTVGDSGVVSWDWSPSGVGLGTGTYRVEVVATRGGHQIVVHDARDLTVVP